MHDIPLGNNVPLAQNDHFGGANNGCDNDDDNNSNNNENQNHDENNHIQVSDDDEGSTKSYDFNYGNKPKDNHKNNHYSEDEEDDDDITADPEDVDQDENGIDQSEELRGRKRRRNRRSTHQPLPGAIGKLGPYWDQISFHICPILGAMMVTEQAGVGMMKNILK